VSPNILTAIKNIADFGSNDLRTYSSTYLIRINAVGQQLEFYVKDALCGSFRLAQQEKETKYQETFSLLGNQNNPPDAIIRGGDAYEIKKIQTPTASIALNSSPPKDRLHRNDSRVTEACRRCEGGNWQTKDMFYVVGCTQNSKIKYLFFVHGTCYSAERQVYEMIATQLKRDIEGSLRTGGIEGSSETVELGRVNRVDPLGITNLRIRGMWMIENPIKVFSYIYRLDSKRSFSLIALMSKTKFDYFPQQDIGAIRMDSRIESKSVKIKNPNNPAELVDAQLITLGW
jgi:hypothetical protein